MSSDAHIPKSSETDPYGELPPDLVAALKPPPPGTWWTLPGEDEVYEKVAAWTFSDAPSTQEVQGER